MSVTSVNPLVGDPAVNAPGTTGQADADRQQVRRLAQEFEAMLMTEMLREMRRSMIDDDQEEDGFGAGTMTDTTDVELGRSLSRVGGLGLADILTRAFERQYAGSTHGRPAGVEHVADTASMTGSAIAAGTDSADPGDSLLADAGTLSSQDLASATISSPFGWRRDPFTGAPRFHAGVDVPIAYGRDVHAAAAGTVVFAGPQGGYGNSVTVDHGDGRQTRYAHLSQQLVRVGDVVAGGQVLGKSGDSGRARGPHLHFEVLVNGKPVDPIIPG